MSKFSDLSSAKQQEQQKLKDSASRAAAASKGSLFGSVLNLATMGTFGDKSEEKQDDDLIKMFFDSLGDSLPDASGWVSNLFPEEALESISREDPEIIDSWKKGAEKYQEDGKNPDLAKKFAEDLDNIIEKSAVENENDGEEKEFTFKPKDQEEGTEEEKDGESEEKSPFENYCNDLQSEFAADKHLVMIVIKVKVPTFAPGEKSKKVEAEKTSCYDDGRPNKVETVELEMTAGDFGMEEPEMTAQQQEDLENQLSSIKENLKDLKFQSVKPGEKPSSGAGMSEEKKKEQEIELPS